MAYIQGFVIAVPTARRDDFIVHATKADPVFLEHGALRVVECWADDAPRGKQTDFYGAVKATDDESIVFSWIEWPDKAASEAMHARMEEIAATDPRFSMEHNPPPFDGMRMIFGGFETILDTGASNATGFIDGFVIPVPKANADAYRKQAEGGAPIFMDLGATRVVECWGDDVPRGKITDFHGAVQAREDEAIVFSWIEYPGKVARNAAGELMMDDPRFAALGEMPFDGKRMIHSGFAPVVDLGK